MRPNISCIGNKRRHINHVLAKGVILLFILESYVFFIVNVPKYGQSGRVIAINETRESKYMDTGFTPPPPHHHLFIFLNRLKTRSRLLLTINCLMIRNFETHYTKYISDLSVGAPVFLSPPPPPPPPPPFPPNPPHTPFHTGYQVLSRDHPTSTRNYRTSQ